MVRPHPAKSDLYELIIGERRWRAAKKAKKPLKVIIKKLSDNEAAIIQAAENENRKDLSDFAKGMSYARLIKQGVLKQKDLVVKLGITKQQVSRLLSFSRIPQNIIAVIGDMTKVSAKTSEKIKQLCDRGEEYKEIIISLANKIRAGRLGYSKIDELVQQKINSSNRKKGHLFLNNRQEYTNNGQHLFTWRSSNNQPSIHFSREIADLIMHENLNLEELSKEVKKSIEKMLGIQSPAGD